MSLLVRTSTDAGALLVRDTDDPLALSVTESTSALALRVRESTDPLAMRVRGLIDPDAAAFISASGATDTASINTFVKGIKALGLWSSMVCWPLRSSQNAGSGTTAFSLGGLGTFNGTLVNGPTWGGDGITFDGIGASNHYLTTGGYLFPGGNLAVGAVTLTVNNTAAENRTIITANDFATRQFSLRYDNSAQRIFMDGNPGTGEVSINQNRNRAIRDFYFGGHNANTLWVRANTTARTTLAATGSIIAPGVSVQIGRFTSAFAPQNMHGEISFVYLCTAALTAAQEVDIFNLYKTTLGQGLGLP
jgi:hypothetical protein